jgi:hypothetical protein
LHTCTWFSIKSIPFHDFPDESSHRLEDSEESSRHVVSTPGRLAQQSPPRVPHSGDKRSPTPRREIP